MTEAVVTETIRPDAASEASYPARWLHRTAVAIVCLVWPLIWVGGLVTTYDAGMAVPDWPNTFGRNLFLYPYETWLLGPFDLFIEHGHRLLGGLVGFVAIGAVVVAWVSEPRWSVRWLSVALLLAITFQGVLGGVRVVKSDRIIAMVHGCTAPVVFVMAIALAVLTSRWWWNRGQTGGLFCDQLRVSTRRLMAIAVVTSYAQLIFGATLRHIPVGAPVAAFKHTAYTHIAVAFLLWGLVIWLYLRLRRERELSGGCGDLTLLRISGFLVLFVTAQISLGLATWVVNYGWPQFAQFNGWSAGYLVKSKAFAESLITTAHVATGSLILGTAAMLWFRATRVARTTRHTVPASVNESVIVQQEYQGLQLQ